MIATVGAFALTAQVEAFQGTAQAEGARAQEIARAGIEYGMARLQDPQAAHDWVADGRPYDWSFAGARVELRIRDESGKVDINRADPAVIADLLRAVGIGPAQSKQLAGAIADWRDPDSITHLGGGAEDGEYAIAERTYGAKDGPFESVAELQQVLGITPDTFTKVSPHLTIFSGLTRPNLIYAPATIREALGSGSMQSEHLFPERSYGMGTYEIESRATLADGRRSVIRAVVRSGGVTKFAAAYSVLRWESGDMAR